MHAEVSVDLEGFTEGEIRYIEREMAYGAEDGLRKAVARLKEIHNASEEVRKAEPAQEGTEGGGPWLTDRANPGFTSVSNVPGAYTNRTAGEARPQAESPQAQDRIGGTPGGDGRGNGFSNWNESWGSPAG